MSFVRNIFSFMVVGMTLVASNAVGTEPLLKFHDVFVGGTEGYHTFRIPAITTSKSGALLAFAEGRVSRSDHARNDIVMKRSKDHGVTWEALLVTASDGDNSLNNPCVVVVRDAALHGWRGRL